MLVFGRLAGDDGSGNTLRRLYVCSRPGGAAHPVTSASLPGDDTGEYPLDERLLVLGFGGRYVGAWVRSGEGSRATCDKYAQPNCPPTTVRLVVSDARSGRRTRTLSTGEPRRAVLSLSAGGALAFLDHDALGVVTLHATRLTAVGAHTLRAAPKVIDAGAIVPGSVHLAGLRLSWIKDATRHSAVIPSG